MYIKLTNHKNNDGFIIPKLKGVRTNGFGLHLMFRDPDFGARMGFDPVDPVLRKNSEGLWNPPLRDGSASRVFHTCEILED